MMKLTVTSNCLVVRNVYLKAEYKAGSEQFFLYAYLGWVFYTYFQSGLTFIHTCNFNFHVFFSTETKLRTSPCFLLSVYEIYLF